MLGSLMMLPSGVLASSPSQDKSSVCFWSSVRESGKREMILPAREMSFSSTAMPMGLANLQEQEQEQEQEATSV